MNERTPYQRRYVACIAGIEAWLVCASPSKAIADTFDDEGMTATEPEIACGLEAVRYFKMGPGSKERVATAVAAG